MKHDKLIKLILAALFAALTCVATSVIHVPIPATNGYINLGDGMVLLGAFLLGPVYGAAAGGLGSMLADLLLGYAAYAPGTLIIKAAMGLCAGLLFGALRFCQRLRLNGILQSMLASALAALAVMLMVGFGLGQNPDKIIIGNIMLLIPGIALTTSLRDMINGDTISGLLGLSEAVLKALAIAIGFAAVLMRMGG